MDVVTKLKRLGPICAVLVLSACSALKVGEWHSVEKIESEKPPKELAHFIALRVASCFGSDSIAEVEDGNSQWFPALRKVVTIRLMKQEVDAEYIMVYLSNASDNKTKVAINVKPIGQSRIDNLGDKFQTGYRVS